MRLVRIYNDADGESHFEDLELRSEMQLSPTGVTADISEPLPTETLAFRNVLSEASDVTPHLAPRRLIIVQLDGTIEDEASDGEVQRFGPGEPVLVEDTAGKGPHHPQHRRPLPEDARRCSAYGQRGRP